jgi:hypothetical protein
MPAGRGQGLRQCGPLQFQGPALSAQGHGGGEVFPLAPR